MNSAILVECKDYMVEYRIIQLQTFGISKNLIAHTAKQLIECE